MATIFTRIINGELPSHRVAEDEHHFAFLDINPVAPGHTLVVPKQEIDYIFDMESDAYAALMQFCHQLAPSVQQAVPCKRVGIAVIGLEVPHVHVHLVPMQQVDDLNFAKPKMNMASDELARIAEKIRQHYAQHA
ncbi:histidine triad (HIT) family protein [Catalinimonas alkaloidigena]|uniref:Histidine triad (HIT) family protein n=1 Tax=Catalinimonas alkaloidigena TaxID=1075417 RepID=A0A1G8WGD4_9BACT|nr:HIT family protein [Catalinimonas alkaloidigena]SDJ77281.1 histidine triad (HIT) family protein [Catalinimonas alkaloidigena]